MGQSEPFSSVTSGGSSSNCFYYFQSSGNGIDFSHAVEKSVRSFGLAAQISEWILHKALEYNHSTSASWCFFPPSAPSGYPFGPRVVDQFVSFQKPSRSRVSSFSPIVDRCLPNRFGGGARPVRFMGGILVRSKPLRSPPEHSGTSCSPIVSSEQFRSSRFFGSSLFKSIQPLFKLSWSRACLDPCQLRW